MILVTGANGFLGSHVCVSLLEHGYRVRAACREGSSLEEFKFIAAVRQAETLVSEGLQWVHCDVLDYESLRDVLEGVEAVFHCAAVVSFWPRMRSLMYQVNVEGTANVVNACLETAVPWLIHTSSIAALGRSMEKGEIDEQSQWTDSPLNSEYALTKRLAETEVWRGREEGLKASMVNPGLILGEGSQNKGSGRLLRAVLSGRSFYTDSTNGYVDVRDVAEAMVRIYEKRIDGERFVLTAENLSAKALFTLGNTLQGKAAPDIEVKPWLLEPAWRISAVLSRLSGKEPLITRETARTASHHYRYSSAKACRELGMDFCFIEGVLRRVLASSGPK